MKHPFIKKIIISLSILMIGSLSLVSCNPNEEEGKTPSSYDKFFTYSGKFDEKDYLKVFDDKVKKVGNDNNGGEEVILRGFNAGGYLIIEHWMSAFQPFSPNPDENGDRFDHETVTNIFTRRFGKERTVELWSHYRDSFWTNNDYLNAKEMEVNSIRLPFSYMSVDPEYNNVYEIEGEKYNFEVLDNFIKNCADQGIYVILDLHGAYGSQNGQDHSGTELGSASEVDFYRNEEKQKKTIDLWVEITKRYKDNPAIACFDLLNEPGEKANPTGELHWEFYDKLTKAIREVDTDRILMYESCWDGKNLPDPSLYNWDNCIYSYHNYTNTEDINSHLNSFRNKLNGINYETFDGPYNMGEFTCYGNKDSWNQTLDFLNDNGWSWHTWTYKLNIKPNGYNYPGWGIYYTHANPVDPLTDSYDKIWNKFDEVNTLKGEDMRFNDGTSLRSIIRNHIN